MSKLQKTVYGYDVNSPTASFVSSKGLSMLFTYVPVPEPSSIVLLFLDLGIHARVRMAYEIQARHSAPSTLTPSPSTSELAIGRGGPKAR